MTINSHDASKEIFLEKAPQEKIFSEIIKHYNKNDPDSDIKTKEIITGKNELKNKINYPIITINTKLKIDEKEYYLIRVIPEEILMTDKKNKKETISWAENNAGTSAVNQKPTLKHTNPPLVSYNK